MTEIANLQDARDQIRALYRDTAVTGLSGNFLDDYAKIAWFLTDNDRCRFYLDRISKELWQTYAAIPAKYANKFFQALRQTAKGYGFYFDATKTSVTDLVTLYSAIPAEDYLGWIAKGVFFKDEMDLKHGEHSHSFQWLAIANWGRRNLNNDAADLYRNIYKIRPTGTPISVPGIKLKPKQPDIDGTRKDVSLWSWLVDCFPGTMANAQTPPEGYSIFSDTFRSPQRVTHYLMNEADEESHFLACYLKSRYRAHNWFNVDYVNQQTKRGETRVFADYEHIRGGATSKNMAFKKQDSDIWRLIGTRENPCGYVRSSNDPQGVVSNSVIEQKRRIRVDKTFHGHTGKMIVHYGVDTGL